jgi:hypothetical protein
MTTTDPPPADVYEAAARAFMANVPPTLHNHWDETMRWERDHPPFRRAVDRVWRDGRAPLLAEIDRLRHQLRCADARIAELAAS